MSDNREPEDNGGGGGNPWLKSLLIWGGIFLALLLAVSMFGGAREAPGTPILYSDFKEKVAAGDVAQVTIAPDRIEGRLRNDERFSTVPVLDPGLAQQLDAAGVEYTGTQADQGSLWIAVLVNTLPFLLILGIAFFALRQVQKGGGGGAMGFGKSKAKLLTEKQGRVTFDDVAGIDEAREELQEIVEFLKDPQRFSKLGGQIPKGAL
ncbi:MAG: ATP-dependent metallopeptidase FtsH/Yme1/Tma family protein, partial [Erythrobacter sp.]|nr:ATP-dependent metallopeptidase FtsH/Yme1/Tma family protein [Erythrobacter sp.]